MRLFMLIPCLIVAVNCHPLARDEYNSQASGLALIEENNDAALRSKRTVGVLRQFFPEITEMIDNIVNKIVSEVIKVVGPTVIQDVLGGNRRQNNGNSKTESEGSEVTIEVPADFFEDSESDSDVADINNKDNFGKVNIPLPTFETTQVTGKGIGNVEEGLTTEEPTGTPPGSGYSRVREQGSKSSVRRFRSRDKRSWSGSHLSGQYRNRRRRESKQKI
ncbi:GSCOCG00001333001-RA-CDS [Cotesia congregata]|nr:GSCOCG00001333001-RA-CDS [Cotesia congregata]